MRCALALILITPFVLAQEQGADDAARKRAELEVRRLRELTELRAERIRIDKRFESLKEKNGAALGAEELERLRRRRADVALAIAKLEKKEDAPEPAPVPDISELLARVKKGDAAAVQALQMLKAKIDRALAPRGGPMVQQVWGGGQQIVFVNGAIIANGRVLPQAPRPGRNAAEPSDAPDEKPVPLSEEERKRLADIDIREQQQRAGRLEERIVELTRRAMELERRIEELRAKSAAAEER